MQAWGFRMLRLLTNISGRGDCFPGVWQSPETRVYNVDLIVFASQMRLIFMAAISDHLTFAMTELRSTAWKQAFRVYLFVARNLFFFNALFLGEI